MAPVAARLAELLGRPVRTVADCVGPEVEAAAGRPAARRGAPAREPALPSRGDGQRRRLRQAAGRPRRGLRRRRLRQRPPRARLHRGRHALPARGGRPPPDPRARDPRASAARSGAPVRRRPRAVSRCRTRSASSRRCWATPTRSSSAAPWPTPSWPPGGSRPAGPRAATATRSRSPRRCSPPRPRRAASWSCRVTSWWRASAVAGARSRVAAVNGIAAGEMALDIGPETAAEFARHLAPRGRSTGTGRWACSRLDDFGAGTKSVGEAIAASAAVTVAGGGDTVAAARRFGLEARMTHVSTGGGASMEFLEGRALPGVEALMDRGTTQGDRPQTAHGRQLEDVQDAGADPRVLRGLHSGGRPCRRPRHPHLPAGRRSRDGARRDRRQRGRDRRPDHALRRRGRLHRRDRPADAA